MTHAPHDDDEGGGAPGGVDALVAKLAAEGATESTGEFTIDRETARRKMQQFQLAEPRSYVVELIQAAVLKGAERIDITVDADDLRITFGGEPFDTTDFDDLYNSLFTDDADRAVVARRQLALGLNAALSLGPDRIEVLSSGGRDGARLELRPDQPDRFEACHDPYLGTRILFDRPFGQQPVSRYVRSVAGRLPEERIVRERGAFCSAELRLNGERVSEGFTLPTDEQGRPAALAREFRFPEGRGIAGLLPDREQGRAHLLKNGVLIQTEPVFGPLTGFVAVVDARALRTDLTLRRFVQDEAYEAMTAALRRARDGVARSLIRGTVEAVGADYRSEIWWREGLEDENLWDRVATGAEPKLREGVVSLRQIYGGPKVRRVVYYCRPGEPLPRRVADRISCLPDKALCFRSAEPEQDLEHLGALLGDRLRVLG